MIKLLREEMKSEGWDLIGGSVPLGSCPWRAVSCHHPFKYISCPPRNKELPLSLTPTNSWCSAQVHRAKGPWTELWNPQFRSIIPHVNFFCCCCSVRYFVKKKECFHGLFLFIPTHFTEELSKLQKPSPHRLHLAPAIYLHPCPVPLWLSAFASL